MQKLLIATKNFGKFKEIESVLKDTPFELINLQDIGIDEDVEETGKTYEENAILKAQFFQKLSGLPTIADDSGITVEALKNELGVKTRRWGAGADASDTEWLDFFLKRMESETNRNSEFFTTIAFIASENEAPQIFRGVCKGIITKAPESEYLKGIPLSAVFKPEGLNCVYSALTPEEKGKISHRGRAASALKEYLKKKDFN